MDINKLKNPLHISDIDFRVQSINNGKYATILPYKDARVDMQVLDNAVGALNWKREHIRDNKNCIISIWDESKKQWVSKEDTGTESNTEQQKGLASDSFKRAAFNWGIGRELYDYPLISIKLNDDEVQETGKSKPKYKSSFKFNLNAWIWACQRSETGDLLYLAVCDNQGVIRYEYGKKNNDLKTQISLTKK